MSSNGFSKENIDKMKQQAIDRANRAHKQAYDNNADTKEKIKNEKISSKSSDNKDKKLTEPLFFDNEKALLTILIILLMEENANFELIFALIYLLI